MRTEPEGIVADRLVEVIERQWTLALTSLDYLPEGGGAYHWVAAAGDARWFVTVDDLDTKPWLGDTRDDVFAGLAAAYRTAHQLHTAGRLNFVVAPVPTMAGDATVRLGDRYTVALFPHVAGEPGRWGEPVPAGERAGVVAMLAALHSAPRPKTLRRRGLAVAGRTGLVRALEEDVMGRRWHGGPLAEPARLMLADNRARIAAWLAELDELADRFDLDGGGAGAVLTHGEPHPGNLIRTAAGFALVDWDTVAAAPPERDLWMLDDGTGAVITDYAAITGRTVDRPLMDAYRRLWALSDIAAFTAELRRRHERNADTERALAGIGSILAGEEPAPYGRPRLRNG